VRLPESPSPHLFFFAEWGCDPDEACARDAGPSTPPSRRGASEPTHRLRSRRDSFVRSHRTRGATVRARPRSPRAISRAWRRGQRCVRSTSALRITDLENPSSSSFPGVSCSFAWRRGRRDRPHLEEMREGIESLGGARCDETGGALRFTTRAPLRRFGRTCAALSSARARTRSRLWHLCRLLCASRFRSRERVDAKRKGRQDRFDVCLVKGDARPRSEMPSIGQGPGAKRTHRSAFATAEPTNETRRSRDEDRRARAFAFFFAAIGLRRSRASGPGDAVAATQDDFRSQLGSRLPASCFERAFDPFATEGALLRAEDACRLLQTDDARAITAGRRSSSAKRGDEHLFHVCSGRLIRDERDVSDEPAASRAVPSEEDATRTAGPAEPSEGSRAFRRAKPLLAFVPRTSCRACERVKRTVAPSAFLARTGWAIARTRCANRRGPPFRRAPRRERRSSRTEVRSAAARGRRAFRMAPLRSPRTALPATRHLSHDREIDAPTLCSRRELRLWIRFAMPGVTHQASESARSRGGVGGLRLPLPTA
jgi:hypothetical protein